MTNEICPRCGGVVPDGGRRWTRTKGGDVSGWMCGKCGDDEWSRNIEELHEKKEWDSLLDYINRNMPLC